MCCLGIDARRCGIPAEDLLNVNLPAAVRARPTEEAAEYHARWTRRSPSGLGQYSTDDAYELAEINDCALPESTDEQKIELISAIFAKYGITVDFRRYE